MMDQPSSPYKKKDIPEVEDMSRIKKKKHHKRSLIETEYQPPSDLSSSPKKKKKKKKQEIYEPNTEFSYSSPNGHSNQTTDHNSK